MSEISTGFSACMHIVAIGVERRQDIYFNICCVVISACGGHSFLSVCYYLRFFLMLDGPGWSSTTAAACRC